MIQVGVCLSGCGFMDGTEIHEAAQILLALDQEGAHSILMAPDVAQARVVDHATGKPQAGAGRNVLAESARIARGKIQPVAAIDPATLDALIFPGGFGAATTLCTFATDGPRCTVDASVERLVLAMLQAGKPLGAACIAPVLLARILGPAGVPATLTIGNDTSVAQGIVAMGCRHRNCPEGEHVTDRDHKIATTPAYMYGESGLATVYLGIRGMVRSVLAMAG